MQPNQFKQTNSLNFPSFPEKEGQIEILIVDNPSQSHDGGNHIHTRNHLGYLHVIVLSQCNVNVSLYISKFLVKSLIVTISFINGKFASLFVC